MRIHLLVGWISILAHTNIGCCAASQPTLDSERSIGAVTGTGIGMSLNVRLLRKKRKKTKRSKSRGGKESQKRLKKKRPKNKPPRSPTTVTKTKSSEPTLSSKGAYNSRVYTDGKKRDATEGSEQDRIDDPDPLPERSGKWFVQYYDNADKFRCMKDCVGPEPCDNRSALFEELHDTFHLCCEAHLWYDDVPCTSRDDNGFILEEEDCTDSYWDTESNELVTTDMIYYASPTICLRDDDEELLHVKQNPDVWKYPSLAECCFNNFHWQFKECMAYERGNALEPCSPPPQYSLKWFVITVTSQSDVPESKCVQECGGPAPCNGRASSYDELYDTFSACCELHTFWKEECMVP